MYVCVVYLHTFGQGKANNFAQRSIPISCLCSEGAFGTWTWAARTTAGKYDSKSRTRDKSNRSRNWQKTLTTALASRQVAGAGSSYLRTVRPRSGTTTALECSLRNELGASQQPAHMILFLTTGKQGFSEPLLFFLRRRIPTAVVVTWLEIVSDRTTLRKKQETKFSDAFVLYNGHHHQDRHSLRQSRQDKTIRGKRRGDRAAV